MIDLITSDCIWSLYNIKYQIMILYYLYLYNFHQLFNWILNYWHFHIFFLTYCILCKTCFCPTIHHILCHYWRICYLYVTNLICSVITDKYMYTGKCKYMLFSDKTFPTASPYMCVCPPPWTAEVHRNERGRDLSLRPAWETQQQSPAVGLCVGGYSSYVIIECM